MVSTSGQAANRSEGHTARPLMDGAASSLLRTDGTADVGAWNREVRMEPRMWCPMG
jgi:hypothetical protein